MRNSEDGIKIKILRSKRGSIMAEAAIIFPVVILTVISVMYICINMYQLAFMNAIHHMDLRKSAENSTKEMIGYEQTISDETSLDSEVRGLIERMISKDLCCEAYAIDEAKFVRCIKAAKEVQ